MQRISDLVEATKKTTEEFRNATPVAVDDIPWESAKNEMEKLTSDFTTMVGNYREYAKKKEIGKYTRILVTLPAVKSYACQLIVYEPILSAELKAWYVMTNKEKGVVYTRKII